MEFNRSITTHFKLIDKKEIFSKGHFLDDYHDIKCFITFMLPALEIIEAKVKMNKLPMEICEIPISKITQLKGLKVGRGFRIKVKKIIGGKNGCIHLLDLIHEMAQGIVALLRKAKIAPDGKELKGFSSDIFYSECIGLNSKK
ncbi:MAG: DUF2889 domain-containing protein [Candidatus Omnitrophica bacterium]|nr:DUF2889 domain-containing protein [Candidatus Omnitrophota bacterium]